MSALTRSFLICIKTYRRHVSAFCFKTSSLLSYILPFLDTHTHTHTQIHIAHETFYGKTIYRNPHNWSDWDCLISSQSRYKHTFCQNLVSAKNCVFLDFRKSMTCLNVGLLRICRVFAVSFKLLYPWVTRNRC